MLEDFKIPYNEIHFGQPYADVYVDASVACSALDTEKAKADYNDDLADFDQ